MQDISNARSSQQVADMKALEAVNVCLFCPEGLNLKDKRVLHKGDYWYVTPNDFPYTGTTIHVMIVPHRHLTRIEDLYTEEFTELKEMIAWVNKEFGIKGAGLFCRYGDTTYTGATIHHFHIHVAQGNQKTPGAKAITALIGYQPATTLT